MVRAHSFGAEVSTSTILPSRRRHTVNLRAGRWRVFCTITLYVADAAGVIHIHHLLATSLLILGRFHKPHDRALCLQYFRQQAYFCACGSRSLHLIQVPAAASVPIIRWRSVWFYSSVLAGLIKRSFRSIYDFRMADGVNAPPSCR